MAPLKTSLCTVSLVFSLREWGSVQMNPASMSLTWKHPSGGEQCLECWAVAPASVVQPNSNASAVQALSSWSVRLNPGSVALQKKAAAA